VARNGGRCVVFRARSRATGVLAASLLLGGAEAGVTIATAQPAGPAVTTRVTVPLSHGSAVTDLAVGRLSGVTLLLSAAADRDREARAWDPVAQRLLAARGADASPVAAVAIDAERDRVLLLSRDGTLLAWRPTDDRVEVLRRDGACREGDAQPRLAVSREHVVLACGATIRLLPPRATGSAAEGAVLTLSAPVTALALDRTGRRLAVGDAQGGLHLGAVDARASGATPPALRGRHAGAVLSLAFSDDGRQLLSGGADYLAILWSLDDSAAVPLRGHRGPVVGTLFDTDGSVLTVSSDRLARRWLPDGAMMQELPIGGAAVTSVAHDPATRWLASGHEDGTVRLWELAAGGRGLGALGVTVRPTQDVAIIAGESGEPAVATVNEAGLLSAWSLTTGRPTPMLAARPWALPAGRARLTAVGSTLAVIADDGGVRMLDGAAAEAQRLLVPPADEPPPRGRLGVALDTNGTRALAVREDGAILRWDVATGERDAALDPIGEAGADPRGAVRANAAPVVTAFAADPEGAVIVRGLSDGRLRVLDLRASSPAVTVGERGAGVSAVAVSDDARWLLGASADGVIRLRARESGAEVAVWRHAARVQRVALLGTAVEPTVLVAGEDGRLCLYRPRTPECAPFVHPDGVVPAARSLTAMAVSPDARLVVTSGSDAWTRVWRLADRRLAFARVTIDSARWLVIDPSGRFDGSPDAIRDLHYRRGLETFGLERFLARDYTPGLASRALDELDVPPARALSRLASPRLSAQVIAGDSSARLLIAAAPAADTTGVEIRVHHNGVGLARLSRSPLCPAQAACFVARLATGRNVFEATRFAADQGASDPARLVIPHGDDDLGRPRTLHVLAVGIDAYPTPDRLGKATTDARDVARALARRGARSFARVVLDTLFDAAATHAAIEAAFARAATLDPDDVFVFLFVGHGLVSAGGGFGLATYAADRPLAQRGLDGARRADGGRADGLVSEAVLRDWLLAVPSLHKVALLDACRSGAAAVAMSAAGAGAEASAAENAARLAWARLGSAGGVFVVGAAGADQFAFEGPPDERNGVFATTLLDVLSREQDGEDRWTMRSLIAALEAQLPRTARRVAARPQAPVVWTLGRDFTLFSR
jgi:WD40 repeat protein